ncbi:MFS transporter [Kineococcus arenarius]|uniref:MFS transporter n=1 Tax=unclassified Kineococcus TaxID=2621656 RepID=UPI003D7CB3B9
MSTSPISTPPATHPATATDARHLRTTVALAVLGVFVTYVPVTSVSVALTTIGTATGAGTADLQWVSDAYVIPMAAAVLSAGVVGDLHGRRRVFLAGMSLTVLGAVIAGLAGTAEGSAAVHALWAGQAVSGLGAGALLPTTLALVAHAVPDPRRRGRCVNAWATGIVVGLALGPLLSGTILRYLDWGWIYAPTGVLAALAAVVALVALPESKAPAGRHLDWAGQVLATVTVAASIYGVIEGGEHGWTSVPCLVALGLAAIALVAFVVAESRSAAPLMELSLYRDGQFTAAGVSALIALFSIVGTAFLLSLFLGYTQRLSPLGIGLRLLFTAGVSALVNPLVGALMSRVRPLVLLGFGMFLSAVALLLIGAIDETTGFADLVWRLAVFGVAMSFMLTPVSVVAINAVPWRSAGAAAATNTALRQYGGALGPAVLGVVFNGRIGAGASAASALSTALLVNVVLVLAAGALCIVVAVRRREDAPRGR